MSAFNIQNDYDNKNVGQQLTITHMSERERFLFQNTLDHVQCSLSFLNYHGFF